MDYGWAWKIPLQHRFGNGYVYDSKFITDDEAKAEIERKIGYEPKYQNIFKFKAGSYKETLINNCIAIGLASSFIEPMEATSISRSLDDLKEIVKIFKAEGINPSKETRDSFNKHTFSYMENVVDFIYLHYITNKTNTPFWTDFVKNNKMPRSLKKDLDFLYNFEGEKVKLILYGTYGYYRILHGNGLMDQDKLNAWYKRNNMQRFEGQFNEYRQHYMSRLNEHIEVNEYMENVLNA
jgi:tryptophan halogenase